MDQTRYPHPARRLEPLIFPTSAVPAWKHPTGRAYLESRGLSKSETEQYQLAFCPDGFWQDRILIPVFQNDTLVAFQGRTVVGTEPRYRTAGTRPMYVPILPKTGYPLFVLEGPFDVFAMIRAQYNAIAVLGILPSNAQLAQLEALIRQVCPSQAVIWFDPDSYAQAATFSLQLVLNRLVPTRVLLLPHIKDPGSLSTEAIQEICHEY